MHVVAAAVGVFTVILYAYRVGVVFDALVGWEKLARFGVGSVLGFAALAFSQRAIVHAPFEWIHWLILGAFAVTAGAYVGMLWPPHRTT